MKDQTFGVEIEMNHITRDAAADGGRPVRPGIDRQGNECRERQRIHFIVEWRHFRLSIPQ